MTRIVEALIRAYRAHVSHKPAFHRGGYIPARAADDDTVLVQLSGCRYLPYDPAKSMHEQMEALTNAVNDTDTEWIVPGAMIKACGPELAARLTRLNHQVDVELAAPARPPWWRRWLA